MKLQEFLKTNGATATAEKLVNMRMEFVTGLGISDFPDRTELWDIVEEIETELKKEDFDLYVVKDILREITAEFIEEICW